MANSLVISRDGLQSLGRFRNQVVSGRFVLFLLAHIPLALLMNEFRPLATLHALAAFAAAVWFALGRRRPQMLAFTAAYIAGAEVLWRMTDAQVFWEFGKYAVIVPFVLFMIKNRQWKHAGLPVLFFVLMSPTIVLTLGSLDLNEARQEISFNLSGPLSLAVSTVFFLQWKFSWQDRLRLALYLAAPVVGICAVILNRILTADVLVFSTQSNFMTSGGFGPNQVSAVLGLGAMLILMYLIVEPKSAYRWIFYSFAFGYLTLCVLTFSRGGLYNLAAALICASVFYIRRRKTRNSLFFMAAVALITGGYVIYPWLNSFTGGMLQARFASVDLTNRAEIANTELEIWRDNPIWGVGPGMGKYVGLEYGQVMVAAHTEYTRILAEHGILGLGSIFILVMLSIRAVLRAPGPAAQAWTVALIVWSLVEMTHAAMRIGAIGFLFGFALCGWYTPQIPVSRDLPSNRNEVREASIHPSDQ